MCCGRRAAPWSLPVRRSGVSRGRDIGAQGVCGGFGRAGGGAVGAAARQGMRVQKGLPGRAVRARKNQGLLAVSDDQGLRRAPGVGHFAAALAR